MKWRKMTRRVQSWSNECTPQTHNKHTSCQTRGRLIYASRYNQGDRYNSHVKGGRGKEKSGGKMTGVEILQHTELQRLRPPRNTENKRRITKKWRERRAGEQGALTTWPWFWVAEEGSPDFYNYSCQRLVSLCVRTPVAIIASSFHVISF